MSVLTTEPEMNPLESTGQVISRLLTTTHSIKSYTGRWLSIRSKLVSLSASVSSVASSPHWHENPLLQTIIPNLSATLNRLETLSEMCSDNLNPRRSVGKLLMQSDLDMASGWLGRHLDDLDLLLRSGVLKHSSAIVPSQPTFGSDKDDFKFFIRDLFTRLQIGGPDFKKKSLQSLVKLFHDDEKSTALVAEEGNMSYLVHLLDLNNTTDSILELAVTVVAELACGGDLSRRRVFEEGGLGPLLRIVESGSVTVREKAVMAVEAIMADTDNAWALSAYGGVPVLLGACKTGTPAAQAHAAGAIRNAASAAAAEDIRVALVEDGAVSILLQVLAAGSAAAQEKAADCIAVLASSDDVFNSLIKRENGLSHLLHVLRESPSADVSEHVLRAIYALSLSDPSWCRVLSSSTVFVIQIAEMIRQGNIMLQQICCLLLSNLSLSDGNKRAVSGCMPALVKLMESSKPDRLREMAVAVLVSLLTVRSNRKELVKDEKSLMRLVQMLDPKYDAVPKELPVAVTAAVLVGGSEGCRKRLVAAGAHAHLQRLVEMEVSGAKKAARGLSGSRLKSLFSRTWRELPGK